WLDGPWRVSRSLRGGGRGGQSAAGTRCARAGMNMVRPRPLVGRFHVPLADGRSRSTPRGATARCGWGAGTVGGDKPRRYAAEGARVVLRRRAAQGERAGSATRAGAAAGSVRAAGQRGDRLQLAEIGQLALAAVIVRAAGRSGAWEAGNSAPGDGSCHNSVKEAARRGRGWGRTTS